MQLEEVEDWNESGFIQGMLIRYLKQQGKMGDILFLATLENEVQLTF